MKFLKTYGSSVWLIFILLTLVLPLIIFRSQSRLVHSCDESGQLRLTMEAVGGTSPNNNIVTGRVAGLNSAQYRADGAYIVLYAKTDIWYNEPDPGLSFALNEDCTWRVTGVHNGSAYAAFFVAPDYQLPKAIDLGDPTVLPPLLVDGNRIIAWALSNTIEPAPAPVWQPADQWRSRQEQALAWLLAQMTPNGIVPSPLADRQNLLISYRVPENDPAYPNIYSRSWLFDDAVAVISLAQNGYIAEALALISAVEQHITLQGEIGFSFKTDDPFIDEVYRTGAIAWFGYALMQYQQMTGDAQSQTTAELMADYLLSLQDSSGSIETQANSGSFATDHNIIAFFFLRDLGRLPGNGAYADAAAEIKESLLQNHWYAARGYFREGIGSDQPGLLEINALGALFLLAVGEQQRAEQLLQVIDATYGLPPGEPATSYELLPSTGATFAQATAQMVLVHHRLGNVPEGVQLVELLLNLQDRGGGVPYAMPPLKEQEISDWPSAAGTNWLLLALVDDSRFLGP
jgi:hypothetical protein